MEAGWRLRVARVEDGMVYQTKSQLLVKVPPRLRGKVLDKLVTHLRVASLAVHVCHTKGSLGEVLNVCFRYSN